MQPFKLFFLKQSKGYALESVNVFLIYAGKEEKADSFLKALTRVNYILRAKVYLDQYLLLNPGDKDIIDLLGYIEKLLTDAKTHLVKIENAEKARAIETSETSGGGIVEHE